ncbi:bifunctional riboflavin kinase/FAD synthetase [Buchnera aphidicola]|uniref:Riboflavin biosynthesis protein n=1 Tax=Buchnera aphidicola str. USDA (Myzus persicae) TaxID=1009856 RepID=W0P4E1_BUCMP|nr:bifunctional riboflavin kinase/FAD synthetase [Buchnera aphidicola]AHG60220.1 Ribf [Buchnera aphidicola str. USDA (Myzus persicae)]AHG60798.1 Ribf [Buchnera aphidicola str. W106 (Myzus persicae)]AHG61370.1 Ribf [Buchnera aphidicola str. G002 (Myzus persicae)]AHG61943.1 Ribf [Buchnera aphidicola str. F009 (Myzus persicae)]WAI03091.1 MAG: bifunctional riboflavin kinase/FAD synthetase [Buchnera aphidicola (Myzus persicae)]
MNIIRGIHNIKEMNSNSVVTIGNFDGIHLGHQKLFSYIHKIGQEYKIPTIIILFEPQPLEFLKNKDAPVRITTFREKIKRISYFNINKVLCIRFNNFFKSLSAEDFIINILINKLHIKFIVIGEDFKFGFKRTGDFDLLEEFKNKYKFQIIKIKSLYKNNIKISSTNIRIALSQNKIKLASLLLGRSYSIFGKVVHGNAIGRRIGYPTANISLKKYSFLKNGVYAVKVRYLSNQICTGICNIGIKKNFFSTKKNRILEVYLFDQNINLYGKYIEVILYKRIRDEKIFISTKELQNQIYQDILIVKNFFEIYKN